MLPPQVLQIGSATSAPPPLELRAGPLAMIFEPHSAFLRYVRLGEREVVRGVYAAVRDHNWDTVAPQVSNLRAQVGAREFHLSFDVDCARDDIQFVWRGEVVGEASGTVRFSMRGEAHSTFRRNRIGFCVLHPMRECAGQPCRVEHSDGRIESSRFPDAIAPHQPFFEMRAITHEVWPGVQAEVRFEGEVFEMEDQRNWTDASYKTYCTPLGLPFPVEVPQGTVIEQAIIIRLHGDVADEQDADTVGEIVLRVDETQALPLPPLGLGMASHEQPLTDREISRLRVLVPSHLRVDLHLQRDFEDRWQRACQEAEYIRAALEVALFLTDDATAELQRLAALVSTNPVTRWLIFHENEKSTARRWVELAREHLRPVSDAPIGAGTNAYFAELNRERPPVEVLDCVAFSINPQVHAFDEASLVETLAAQAATVDSARRFCGDLPIVVSPVTLQPRFNPNATGPEPEPAPGELPSQVDVRQMSLFGASWTLGSIKHLSQSGAASVTYYETTGWRGVMETAASSPLPEKFRSIAGAVFPLYHVLTAVAEFRGGEVLTAQSSEPLRVEGLALRQHGRRCLLLGNLTGQPQRVRWEGIDGTPYVKVLDATNAEAAMTNPEKFRQVVGTPLTGPLVLPPYALARLDFGI
ncbi:MAG: hypothetical protein M3347_02165 [Armatimonadota bacterium]|nr:hypothetical protein [Armatimonadota bacterium]